MVDSAKTLSSKKKNNDSLRFKPVISFQIHFNGAKFAVEPLIAVVFQALIFYLLFLNPYLTRLYIVFIHDCFV